MSTIKPPVINNKTTSCLWKMMIDWKMRQQSQENLKRVVQ